MIYLYSHDAAIRERWSESLGSRTDVQMVPQAQNLAAALTGFPEGVVLVDLAAEDLRDRSRLETLCVAHPGKRFVAAYSQLSPAEAVSMFQVGVRGYCNRYLRAELLVEVIRVVEQGEVWVGEQLMSGLLRALPRTINAIPSDDPVIAALTDRERDVVPYIINGLSNKHIARELDITERTVKAHVSSILRKLGVADRMQLAFLLTRPAVRI